MSSLASPRPSLRPARESTGAQPLLLWLAVICGLVGITMVRFDDLRSVVPIWFGAIVGLSLGQLFALLRLRVLTLLGLAISLIWIGPAVVGAADIVFQDQASTAVMALAPAIVCGYASFTARGAFVAFWYPTMLWMLVILDVPSGGAFTKLFPLASALRSSIGLVCGLGALFVLYLRAAATRRVALWKAASHERLATPIAHTTLRASPIRSLSEGAFVFAMGLSALALAVWIAPELWHKQIAHHPQPQHAWTTSSSALPCEPAVSERVDEYFELERAQDIRRRPRCEPNAQASSEPTRWTYSGMPGAGFFAPVGASRFWGDDEGSPTGDALSSGYEGSVYGGVSYGGVSYGGSAYNDSAYGGATTYGDNGSVPSSPPVAPTLNPTPILGAPRVSTSNLSPEAHLSTPATTWTPPPITPPPSTTSPTTHAAEVSGEASTPDPGAPIPISSPPWRVIVGLFFLIPLTLVAWRSLRRALTLRHFERPFWPETVPQQISNQWQRALIGLRDAGILPKPNEQPHAFAKRVGIDAMTECATILERVRHGVRVEEGDLETMSKASRDVYRTSRARAGLAGRLAGSVRWPL